MRHESEEATCVRGAFLSLGTIGTWLSQMTGGLGWVALAIVIFANWMPLRLIGGALLFGALGTFGNVAQALGWSVSSEIFSALPYLGTIFVLIALLHLLRLIFGWEATLNGAVVPMWASLAGLLIAGGLAAGLWWESRK